MNIKQLWILVLFLIAGSFSIEMIAQENIQAVIKKCESIESVEMSVIKSRNAQTNKIERVITSISFSSNPSLLNEFLAAFKKDEEKASKVIENKVNGKLVPSFYRFKGVAYSFSMDNSGNVSISEIRSDD